MTSHLVTLDLSGITLPGLKPFASSATMAPGMARLRRDTQDTLPVTATHRPLRVVASGTLFLTHTLSLASHPEPASVVRAHSVARSRGGSASTCLSVLAQFPGVEAMLVAPLGGNEEGKAIISELEQERVSTKYCKVWEQSGVPSAWVLHAGAFPHFIPSSVFSSNPRIQSTSRSMFRSGPSIPS